MNNVFSIINEYQDKYPVDVEKLAKELGIDVIYANLGLDVSGMLECVNDKNYVITVNENDAVTRQRFTIAHELGHFVYHRDKIGEGIDDDRAYRSTDVGKYHNTSIGRREETQANRFAANLLMPWSVISKLQDEGVNNPEEIASKLIVSPQAMRIRLGI